jgi:hypothetical protein
LTLPTVEADGEILRRVLAAVDPLSGDRPGQGRHKWVKVFTESIVRARIIVTVADRIICSLPVATGLSALGRAVGRLASFLVSDAFFSL